MPRNRPPFPVTHGFLGKPTVVNNVETFAAAALIAAKGGDWYRSIGTAKSTGTKLLSVSGDLPRPGIYEYPFGVTVRRGAGRLRAPTNTQAVQISGPSGICVADNEFDRRIAFEDIPTAGAFMVFDHSRDMFEVARNFAHFFAHESCGFCTPCRVGTTLLKNLMDKIGDGHGTQVRHQRDPPAIAPAADGQPLRPRPHGAASAARHPGEVPPGLRAAAEVARLPSRPSTSTARSPRPGR